MALSFVSSPLLKDIPNLCHGFTTREGGVSASPYASLNFGWNTGDEDDLVDENYARLGREFDLSPTRIVGTRQVHGIEALEILAQDDAWSLRSQDADILITREKGILLSVRVADCVPILVVEPEKKILGVVHAGWRGTLEGVLPEALEMLSKTYGCHPSGLFLALGPAIGLNKFEVGHGIVSLFAQQQNLQADEVREGETSAFLDLCGINRRCALESGVPAHQIWQANQCTFENEEKFFSYRRDGKKTGRQLGFVGWLA